MKLMPEDIAGISLAGTRAEEVCYFPSEPVTPGRGCLIQIYPAAADSQLVRLGDSLTLLGRDPVCDVVLNQTAVSRRHAAIDLTDDGYVVRDLNSTNGTFLDDEKIEGEVLLQGGELIRIGNTVLKFLSAMDQEAQYHEVVRQLMTRDPLTNTFNRGFLIPTLEKQLRNSAAPGTAVILLDLDLFKSVNDTYGHLVGDEVLRIFCERIRPLLRSTDLLARLGGEEFLILCPQTSQDDALRVAERVRLSVSGQKFSTQAGRINVSCSLGVTFAPASGSLGVDDVLAEADHWLYVAKHDGRNCVRSRLDGN
ncbi:MAG: diguanylate cyclase [Planctomycetaceae bacterium]|nr:diguanylate cyclase [Planctomycetaceae bacterium]